MSLVFRATTPLVVVALFHVRNNKKPPPVAVLSPLEKTAAVCRGGLDVKVVAFDDDADAEDDARDDDDALFFLLKGRKGGCWCFGPLKVLSNLLLLSFAVKALLVEKIVVVLVVVLVVIAAFVRVCAFRHRQKAAFFAVRVCEWTHIFPSSKGTQRYKP